VLEGLAPAGEDRAQARGDGAGVARRLARGRARVAGGRVAHGEVAQAAAAVGRRQAVLAGEGAPGAVGGADDPVPVEDGGVRREEVERRAVGAGGLARGRRWRPAGL
jgi:hypothetical protein